MALDHRSGIRHRYVLGFLLSIDLKQVALIRKGLDRPNAGLLNGLGGKFDKEKDGRVFCLSSAKRCMAREFEEESGVRILAEWWHSFAMITSDSFTINCFSSRSVQIDDVKKTTEEPVWIFNVEEVLRTSPLREGICPDLRWLIPMAMRTELYGDVYYSMRRSQKKCL
jgi:8-oxo-dGTP pyrophosphatase MutT (NUDIX family)